MSDSTNPKDLLGVKKAPLRFVPPALAIVASDALADGVAKYGPFNWRETSVRLTVYLEAIERHLVAMRDGQDRAEDSGHLHIGHIAACCGIIADADALGMLIDDRFTAGPAADMLRERDKTANLVFDYADTRPDPPVNVSAVADSEGDVKPLAVCSVGDTVQVRPPRLDREHTHGAIGGLIGHVREITADYVLVDIPGYRRPPAAPDGLWRFLPDEIEVLT